MFDNLQDANIQNELPKFESRPGKLLPSKTEWKTNENGAGKFWSKNLVLSNKFAQIIGLDTWNLLVFLCLDLSIILGGLLVWKRPAWDVGLVLHSFTCCGQAPWETLAVSLSHLRTVHP